MIKHLLEKLIRIVKMLFFWPAFILFALYKCTITPIEQTKMDWKVVSPGAPLEKFPTVRVLEAGLGPKIEVGDLVQINVQQKWLYPYNLGTPKKYGTITYKDYLEEFKLLVKNKKIFMDVGKENRVEYIVQQEVKRALELDPEVDLNEKPDTILYYEIHRGIKHFISEKKYNQLKIAKAVWSNEGEWWVWVGFTQKEDTDFFQRNEEIVSSLVGLREGDIFDFTATPEMPIKHHTSSVNYRTSSLNYSWLYTEQPPVGWLYTNVMGDKEYYDARKSLGYHQANIYVSPPSDTKDVEGYREMRLKVTRVCKAHLKTRETYVYDDSLIWMSKNWLEGRFTTEPREWWVEEAKIEGKCSDGKIASFQYGPRSSRDQRGIDKKEHHVTFYSFTEWDKKHWRRVPVGVQLRDDTLGASFNEWLKGLNDELYYKIYFRSWFEF